MSRWMVGSSVASSTRSGLRNSPFSTGGPDGAGGGAAAGEDAHPIAAAARRTARYRFRIPEAYWLTADALAAGRRRPHTPRIVAKTMQRQPPGGSKAATTLSRILDRLRSVSGRPKKPPSDPFALILLENVAYLADDARR